MLYAFFSLFVSAHFLVGLFAIGAVAMTTMTTELDSRSRFVVSLNKFSKWKKCFLTSRKDMKYFSIHIENT